MNIVKESIRVEVFSQSSVSIGWNGTDGLRYHVWLNRQTRERSDSTLYRNPPLGVKYGDKANGYFNTRQLDVNNKANRPIFDFAMNYAIENKLFEGAEEKVTAEKRMEDDRNALAYAMRCKKEAGPVLYAALESVVEYDRDTRRLPLDLWTKIQEAIAAAQTEVKR